LHTTVEWDPLKTGFFTARRGTGKVVKEFDPHFKTPYVVCVLTCTKALPAACKLACPPCRNK